MLIAYTDASIIKDVVYLGFYIEFEDKSVVRRRIVMNKTDSNSAEALALNELINFLEYYGFSFGEILIDSWVVSDQLKNKRGELFNKVLYRVSNSMEELEYRLQLIPRTSNKAHIISNKEKFKTSHIISSINREVFSEISKYPDYFLSFSTYRTYKQLTNKNIAFPDVQRKLNEKIWLGKLVCEQGDVKEYAFYDMRIEVLQDVIVNIFMVNYIVLKHHWRAMKKIKKLRKKINPKIKKNLTK